MAVKLSQSLKQSQQLTMTPQLQQAIKLLTLTHLEMTNVIAEEMVENPVLEEAEIDRPVEDDSSREGSESSSSQTDIVERIVDGESGKNTKDDFDWNSYIESTSDS
ncbi:MAG: RNA polymerase sigma-54 factor, partial [Bdellovibrionales bacterium]|nr:RNA polymerase sigma-54 factor [Bdellovibrionales bacterium]